MFSRTLRFARYYTRLSVIRSKEYDDGSRYGAGTLGNVRFRLFGGVGASRRGFRVVVPSFPTDSPTTWTCRASLTSGETSTPHAFRTRLERYTARRRDVKYRFRFVPRPTSAFNQTDVIGVLGFSTFRAFTRRTARHDWFHQGEFRPSRVLEPCDLTPWNACTVYTYEHSFFPGHA